MIAINLLCTDYQLYDFKTASSWNPLSSNSSLLLTVIGLNVKMLRNICAVFLFFVAFIPGLSSAYGNTTAALLSYPDCAADCATPRLALANCSSVDLQTCFCTNDILQYQIASCVRQNCNFKDKLATIEITQLEICNGVPKPWIGRRMIISSIVVAAFTFTIVILRFYARIMISKQFWWDDGVILMAAILMVPNTAFPIYLSYHGIGSHFYDLSYHNQSRLRIIFWVSSILYVLVQNLPKFSMLLFYLRIFPTRRLRIIIFWFIGLQSAQTIAFVLALILQCIPISSVWDSLNHGTCINVRDLTIVGGALSIVEDIIIIALPMRELWKLQLGFSKKFGVAFVFALGSFACVASMVRLTFVVGYGGIDVTYNSVNVIIWSQLESYLAVVCACLPSIVPLLQECLSGLLRVFRAAGSTFLTRHSSAGSLHELGPRDVLWEGDVETTVTATHPLPVGRLNIRRPQAEHYGGPSEAILVVMEQRTVSEPRPENRRMSGASYAGWKRVKE